MSALVVLAATSAAAALACMFLRRRVVPGRAWNVVRENFSFGKWLVGAITFYWLSCDLYPYLVAIFVGTAGTAGLKVAIMLLGLLNIVLMSLDTLLPIRLSAILASAGEEPMREQLRKVQILVAPVIFTYCLIMAVSARPLLRIVFGNAYAGEYRLVALISVYYFLLFLVHSVSAGLRAKRMTRSIFAAYGFATILALSCGWLLIDTFGVTGAAVGMIASAAIANAVCWWAYVRSRGALSAVDHAVLEVNAK